ncbi:MAG: hypothetical protein NUW37_19760 [Planctomycetes bacterium]|nr:hypothetical protein [Planctomycetota bacterium]
MVAPIEKPNMVPLDFRPSYYDLRVEETPASVGARSVSDKHVREKQQRPLKRRRQEPEMEQEPREVEPWLEAPPSVRGECTDC